jgi:UDP-2,3-diacylglucosamine pyrophosphatase LpxH
MQTIITSDVHIGSRHTCLDAFVAFLDTLPPAATLVLNGDIMSHRYRRDSLTEPHAVVLQRLLTESTQRRIVWINGNNDPQVDLPPGHNIEFRAAMDIGTLHIEHGHRFDRIMPRIRPCLCVVKRTYDFVELLYGGRRHIADTAKFFTRLYQVLTRHVARNAVAYAARHGATAIACGHTHYPEDRIIDGIRYLNTGAWTEPTRLHIVVRDGAIDAVWHPLRAQHGNP